jgi:hypothetical protein
MDVFSTELGIWLGFVKTSEFLTVYVCHKIYIMTLTVVPSIF